MSNNNFIPLSVPNFSGNERKYVNDAVVSEWVSTGGSLVNGFEKKVAEYTSMKDAVACNSGTAGLHLAQLVAGVNAGDEVLAPALTFIAAVNPIRYVFAEPVFIGCDDTLCICPIATEEFLVNCCEMRSGSCYNKKTNAKVSAIVVVHVFGNIAAMEKLMPLAKKYNLALIEDATEALGSYYTEGEFKGKMAGTIGDIGVYSFNGNKIITTGSGGMVVSNHSDWLEKARYLSTQAKDDLLNYLHGDVGYNYRLTNVQAAMGLAQLEQLEGFIAAKQENYKVYKEALNGKNTYKIMDFREDIRSNMWFYSLVIEGGDKERDELIAKLDANGIQTRPIWALINEQKPYIKNAAYGMEKAESYRSKIVNIPCSTSLTAEDRQRVIDTLLSL